MSSAHDNEQSIEATEDVTAATESVEAAQATPAAGVPVRRGQSGAFARFASLVNDESLATLSPRQQAALIRRAAWQLTWPVIADQSLMTLVQVVNMAMVGRLGASAIAASGLSFQPFMLVSNTFMGLSVGTTALVARFIGAGDQKKASATLQQSMLLGVLLGALVTLVGIFFAGPVVRIMRPQPDVLALGIKYVRAMSPGLAFMIILTMAGAALRGAGDTRTPMAVNIIVNLTNVVLSWTLIFGHFGLAAMGIVGAGIATSLARATGGILIVYLLCTNQLLLRLNWKRIFTVDGTILRRLWNVGLPSGLERLINSTGQLLYVRQVSGLGTIAYATHALAMNVESLSFMPGQGFSTAASTLVGLNLGARRPAIAEKSAVITTQLGTTIMGLAGMLFFLAPSLFLHIYTRDAAIIALGVVALRIVALEQIPEAIGSVLSGALRGAGDTRAVLAVTVIGVWVVRLGLSPQLIQRAGMGAPGAWVAMLSDWVFRATVLTIVFRSGRWKRVKL